MAAPVASNYRAQVELPVRGDFKNIWDRYQVKWLGSFDGNPFLVLAELLPGWSMKTLEALSPSTRVFNILDSDGALRVKVRIEGEQMVRLEVISGAKLEEVQNNFNTLLTEYSNVVKEAHLKLLEKRKPLYDLIKELKALSEQQVNLQDGPEKERLQKEIKEKSDATQVFLGMFDPLIVFEAKLSIDKAYSKLEALVEQYPDLRPHLPPKELAAPKCVAPEMHACAVM